MTKEEWTAIKNKDKDYDGQFVYALKSSKRVCRPSCTSPKNCTPVNVIIFETIEDAVEKGYHPCSHCRPDMDTWRGSKQELVESARKLIEENYRTKFELDLLAQKLFINKYYISRIFKEATGSTLLQYHNHVRCEAAKKLLTRSELTMSYISTETGFVSASHFSRTFRRETGVSPSEYRRNYLLGLDA